MIRLVACLVAAIALLLSPVSMASMGEMAMAHDVAVELDQRGGHCGNESDTPDGQETGMKSGCASACAALGAVAPSPGSPREFPASAEMQAPDQFMIGVPPEGETPPPRITPEI